MQKNIYAHTFMDPCFPAFISINKLDEGDVEVIVRSKAKQDGSCGDTSSIKLVQKDVIDLVNALMADAACGQDQK